MEAAAHSNSTRAIRISRSFMKPCGRPAPLKTAQPREEEATTDTGEAGRAMPDAMRDSLLMRIRENIQCAKHDTPPPRSAYRLSEKVYALFPLAASKKSDAT
mgnify:CR=1 FL=1